MVGSRMAGRKEFEQTKKGLDEKRSKKVTVFWGARTPVLDLTFLDPYISLVFKGERGLDEREIPEWAERQYQITVANNKRDGREEIFTMNEWDYEAVANVLLNAKVDIEGALVGVRIVGRKENYTYDVKVNPQTVGGSLSKPKAKEIKDEADEDTTRMVAQKIQEEHPDYSKTQIRLWLEEKLSNEKLRVNKEIRDKVMSELFPGDK